MALPLYLAMTAAEMRENAALPPFFSYMACHFSPYGTGLSNCPKSLPEGSLLILNDRTPIHGHDHRLIASQLEEMANRWAVSGVLLDFQRLDCQESAALAAFLAKTLPCPVGVSESYAGDLDCPILLPPAPLDTPLAEYLRPWQGREIWLEAALDGLEIALTESGAATMSLSFCETTKQAHADEDLHCHYTITEKEDQVCFTLSRSHKDLDALLSDAESLGVTLSVGLWQELREGQFPSHIVVDP